MATYTTLQNGSSGSEVKKLQQALKDAGYGSYLGKAGVDGIYGSGTASAVKAYQKANNLTVDGIAGNQTLGKLYGGSAATSITTKPSSTYQYEEFKYTDPATSDVVKEADAMIQQQLANRPTQQESAYQSYLTDTMNKLLNKEEFSYDLNGDALYQQYKDQYTTQGQIAMMDTMGQAAAMTGGYGNSYAQSVGQQAYQGYLQQLNDKVPELYQLARSQYDQDLQHLKDQASMLNTLVEQDYDKYRDETTDWKDMLTYYTNNANTVYDRVAADQDFRYKVHNDNQSAGYKAQQDAYDRAVTLFSLGVMPESTILETAGISSTEAQSIIQKVKEQAASSDSSGSGGSEGTESYDTRGYTTEEIKTLQKNAGITVDGIWGAQTEAAYEKGIRPFVSGSQYTTKQLADMAIDYFDKNPDIKLDYRTLDMWLHDNGISGEAATTFKAYLKEAGATTSGRR